MAHRFTIGVEEEFQIIDPDTVELRSHVVQLLSAAATGLGDRRIYGSAARGAGEGIRSGRRVRGE
jgi:hypothetical protein